MLPYTAGQTVREKNYFSYHFVPDSVGVRPLNFRLEYTVWQLLYGQLSILPQNCKIDVFSRYAMPNGYIAVSDVLEKKSFLKRPRSISYTKGSFESIAEEDEESLEDVKNIRTFMYLTYLSSFFL